MVKMEVHEMMFVLLVKLLSLNVSAKQLPYSINITSTNTFEHTQRISDSMLQTLIPCIHGTPSTEQKKCKCSTGYTGDFCDRLISVCKELNPCKHNATCTDHYSKNNSLVTYSCSCLPQFTGRNCSRDTNPCEPNPCYNSNCTMIDYKSYQCTCTDDTCRTVANDGEEEIVIIPVVGVLVLIGVAVAAVFIIRYCRNKSGMEGTYHPDREEQVAGTQPRTSTRPKSEVVV